MSPGRRPSAADANPPRGFDQVVLAPLERRRALLRVIDGAERRLVLSLFRCDDEAVLAGLAAALARGVAVDALLTARAKGGRGRLRRLWDTLEKMGAAVSWYGDRDVKYHAKYLVADDGPAVVATLNPTRKCFTSTWDALVITDDSHVVESLLHLFEADAGGRTVRFGRAFSPRVIVGPDRARTQVGRLIAGARESIRILDHKLSDPEMAALLASRRARGVRVTVVGSTMGPLEPHGKLMILDDARAMIGSLALSTLSLDARRELALLVDDAVAVRQLATAFEAQRRGLTTDGSGDWW